MAFYPQSDVREYLKISTEVTNDQLNVIVKSAQNYIENFTYRNFTGTNQTATERQNVWLSVGEIKGVHLLRGDAQTCTRLVSFDSNFDDNTAESGVTVNKVFNNDLYFTATGSFTVIEYDYEYGWQGDIPDQVNQAYLLLINNLLINSDPADASSIAPNSERIGDYQYNLPVSMLTRLSDSSTLQGINALLNPYKFQPLVW